MKELIIKARYKTLEKQDKEVFSMLNQEAFEKYMDVFDYDEYESEEKFKIPATEEIDWTKLEELLEQIELVETEIKQKQKSTNTDNKDWKELDIESRKKDNHDLKFNSVRKEFENVGLKVPRAFEKLESSDRIEISWNFKWWVENELSTDYFILRSRIIPICLEIENDENYTSYIEDKNTRQEIIDLFSDIINLFPENRWIEDNQQLYIRIIKECVKLCEKSKKPVKMNDVKLTENKKQVEYIYMILMNMRVKQY